MSFLDDVRKRRSVRTFDGKNIDDATYAELKRFAATVKNPYNKEIRFAFLDAEENKLSSPVLSGEKLYVSAMMKKGDKAEEAYGYAFEALLVHAHKLGLGTVWIGGTMPRDKFEKASNLKDDEIMPCVSPLGGIADKMAVKEVLMRKGVKADWRMDFENLFFEKDFSSPVSEERAEELGLRDALEAVRVAPSAVNKQPWRVVLEEGKAHFYEKHDKGYTNEYYDLQKVDVGIALYHFEQQLLSEGRQAILTVEKPAIQTPSGIDYIATYKF